jgi:hypothetical protein
MTNFTVATYPGRGLIWTRVAGFGTVPKNIGWGLATVTNSQSSNVNLFYPQTEARTAGTVSVLTTTQLGDTYQVTGTIVCTTGKTIGEAALFDSASPTSPTTTISSLSLAGTSITLAASLTPTAGNFYAQIENETVLVTGAAATSVTVTRGALGSLTATHVAGVPITVGGDGSSSGGPTLGGTLQTAASINPSYGGNMFIHADFGGIALNTNDSISFTFTDTLT